MDFVAPDNVVLNLYNYDVPAEAVTIPLCGTEGGAVDCSANSAYAVRHESYNMRNAEHDFALIILPNTAEVNMGPVAKINPVKLNSNINVPSVGEVLETFGWGSNKTLPVLTKPEVPNTVNLHYLPNDECKQTKWGDRITGSMLCAVGNGTTSVFKGDTGM